MSFITYDFINGDYIKLNFEFFFLLFISFEGLPMAVIYYRLLIYGLRNLRKNTNFFFVLHNIITK